MDGEGFDTAVQGLRAFILAIVQVGLGHAQCGVLKVVRGHAHLSDELLLGCRELQGGERLGAQALQLLQCELYAAVGVVGIGTEVDVHHARVGIARQVALHVVYQSRVFAQGEVEAAVHARSAQHVVEQVEPRAALVRGGVAHAAHHHMRLMRVARHLHLARHVGERCRAALVGTARGNVGREALGPHHDAVEGDVAIDKQHRIGRVVVTLGEAASALRGEALDMLRRTQDVVSQGVPAEERVLEIVENQFGRVVLVAVYLLEDDAALLVNLLLREGAVEDDVGEQLQGTREILLQEGRVHHRLLLVGEGIEVAPHILHAVQYVPRAALRGTLEQHVLHEMGQARLVGLLVASAGIDGIAAVDHRCGRRGVDDAQAVCQCMGVVCFLIHLGGKISVSRAECQIYLSISEAQPNFFFACENKGTTFFCIFAP